MTTQTEAGASPKDAALKLALDTMENYDLGNSVAAKAIKEALATTSTKCEVQPEQEPVAYIHRNEYNEYRLEPHDNFDIKSIPFNVDVLLFKAPQRKPLTDKQLNIIGSRWHLNLLGADEKAELFAFAHAIEAAHGIKE